MHISEGWMKRLPILIVLALVVAVVIIWLHASATFAPLNLTVSFLDVGQGDAVLVTAPSGVQVLVDGGPGQLVLTELARHMDWSDRHIDMLIATHPDADHISGLIDVLDRYEVDLVVQSSVLGDTEVWQRFQSAIEDEGAERVVAMRGQIFDLGEGAYIEVLFPDRLLPNAETNTASIVAKVVYDDTSFLLTGDSPQSIERYLVSLDRYRLESTVLKAGHHGSKTSTAPLYIGYVNPELVVLSRGCNNRYGHPSAETLAMLAQFEEQTYDTCIEGTITYVSDGVGVVMKGER